MRSLTRRKWLGATTSSLLSTSGLFSCRPDPPPQDLKEPARKTPSGGSPSASDAQPPAAQAEESSPLPSEALKKVYLQPLGEPLATDDLLFIENALHVFFLLEVVAQPTLPLPKSAYYLPRARYRAEKLLDFLGTQAPPDTHVIVGLTSVDISTTKGQYEDWGILGLATVDGTLCVVSKFRAQRGAQSATHTSERLAKTVVHEVGHTLGLNHCPHHGCLMEDGKGSVTTTDHEYDLCDTCRAKIGKFVRVRDAQQIPWPRP
jgi:archaemetzincin